MSTDGNVRRAGFFSREAIVAPAGWSRWLVPPAALSVHLAIGQAYAWSTLKVPLEDALDVSSTASALPFQLAIVMLGLSAAFGGTQVERRGPRWAMSISLVCFSSGFLIAALGISLQQFWLVVVGYGLVGGVGLGVGYISPVSTLIKWFVDRPGMATGIAIMGFGGGALIAQPMSSALLSFYGHSADAPSVSGVALTFLTLGVIYAIFMSVGPLLVRVPARDWTPPRPASAPATPAGGTTGGPAVSASGALRTPQFWLLWVILCFNVTAGIGILERAQPIYSDFFSGTGVATQITAAATAFTAILSLANMLGRFVWSSTSDIVGRKNIYRLYLGVGALLYLVILTLGESNRVVFLLASLLILSFYGAGFATIPAYLKDLFGTYQVGAIHGRLLTAWSVAGVLGPLIVNAIVDAQPAELTGPARYTVSFSIMISLLVVGFIANELVRPVAEKHYVPESERGIVDKDAESSAATSSTEGASR